MKAIKLSLSLVLLLAAGLGNASGQRLHPKLKSGEKKILNILILPPKVEILKSGMKGGEGMIREAGELETALSDMVARLLRERNLNPLQNVITPQAFEADSDLKYSLADLQTRYDALGPKLHKQQKDVQKGRFSLGDEVAKLKSDAAADTLLFIRGQGVVLTGGKRAFGILVAGPKNSSILLSISLVDALTGEVLYFTETRADGDFVHKTEKVLAKRIAKSLKKLPQARKP